MASLTKNIAIVAGAPDGVTKLRALILSLAVMGKLERQCATDQPTSLLLKDINAEFARLSKDGKIKKRLINEDHPVGLFLLPEGWRWCTLAEICTVVTDGDHQAPPQTDSGVPFLVISDIRGGKIDLTSASRCVPLEYFEALDWAKKAQKFDVLLSVVGSYGIPVPVDETQTFCFQRHIALLRPALPSLQPWLIASLKSPILQQQMSSIATGTAQKTVPLTGLRNCVLPLPPLAEQQRIIAKIDELMRLCDQLDTVQSEEHALYSLLVKTLVTALIEAEGPADFERKWLLLKNNFDRLFVTEDSIDSLKLAMIQLAVMGKLVPQSPSDEPAGNWLKQLERERKNFARAEKESLVDGQVNDVPLPAGWEWARLWQIAENIQYGYTASADHVSKQIRMLRITDIQDDRVNWDAVPGCNISESQFADYSLDNGDIVIARTGGTIGKSYLVENLDHKAVFASYLIRIKKLKSSYPPYLKVFLGSQTYWKQLTAKSMGTGQPNVSGTSLKALAVPIPPIAEQRRIVDKIQNIMLLCDRLKAELSVLRAQQDLISTALIDEVGQQPAALDTMRTVALASP